jgi:hypothetical protein
MRKSVLIVVLLFAVPVLAVQIHPPDPNQSRCVPRAGIDVDPSKRTYPTNENPVVKTVRFTDEGEYVSRCELSDLLYELKAGGPQLVVLYIHGWKHNGDPTDEDYREFNKQLAAIRDAQASGQGPQRRVVGIYVGWNGKLTTLPLLKEFTFWGRKRAADKVAQSAVVTRLIAQLDSIQDKRKTQGKDDLHVYLGHSFGARILYNAVAQPLIRATELAHPADPGEYDIVDGPGDIVILLNPAFEASLFSVFHGVRRKEYSFRPNQPPLLVSVSSDTDTATKLAFPVGQRLNFERLPKRRTTLGNFEMYKTHRVTLRAETTAPDAQCSTLVCMALTAEDKLPNVPFINATASSAVIDGHNDIWNDNVKDFVAYLVAYSSTAAARVKASALPADPSASAPSLAAATSRD